MDREVRKIFNEKQKMLELGGYIATEARQNMAEYVNMVCNDVCTGQEIPAIRLFIPTSTVVNQALNHYNAKEDGSLADYVEWFAFMGMKCFVEEAKEPDNFVRGTHEDKSGTAMESLFPMDRAVVKASLRLNSKDADTLSKELKWEGPLAEKAIELALKRYEYELSLL